ncbi:hypothetical protein F5Y04DRAFT_204708 [Hypomontagnella monticulosa]|nr:hypothetical protein F5Y04DRAFT_204708 [Hypomontagnella monticulosa]
MFPTDFNLSRFCVWILLWSGLLRQSRCDDVWTGEDVTELGVLGSPDVYVSTITITTTIAYHPAVTPGDSIYTLQGCYSQGTDGSGHPFGDEGSYTTPTTIPSDQLTVEACVNACGSLSPPNGDADKYQLAGVGNGSQCFCGSQLAAGAQKLDAEDCKTPCTGDSKLTCGGKDTIAVYGLTGTIESTSIANDGENAGSSRNSDTGDKNEPPTGVSLSSSATDEGATPEDTDASQTTTGDSKSSTGKTGTAGAANKVSITSSSSSESSESPSEDSSDKAPTTMTIAAITGSLSGGIILAAVLFLCFRAYRRKKQKQDLHVNVVLDKQQKQKDKRLSQRPVPSAIDTTGIDLSNLVPSTPALESGSRFHSQGLHPRRKSAISPSDRDGLYHALLQEVRSGPSISPSGARRPSASVIAASSAVQWREPPATPTSVPVSHFNFDFNRRPSGSNSPLQNPAPTARLESSLGDRAWHRRKISTTFQPPASGPPNIPLPPTPPMRPRKSFDTVRLPPTSNPSSWSGQGSNQGKEDPFRSLPATPPLQPRAMYTLGESANISTRSLGTLSTIAPTPPPKDTPAVSPTTREQPSPKQRRLTPFPKMGDSSINKNEETGNKEGKRVESTSTIDTISTSLLFPSDDEQEMK